MWKKGIGIGFVTAGLFAGALAFAGGPEGHEGHNPLAWVIQELELNADQQAMVEAWRSEARAEREVFRAEREAAKETLQAELISGNPDPKVFHRLIDDRIAERKAHMHDQVDKFFELYATFTPDQKAELTRIIEERPAEGYRRGRR